MDDTPGSPAPKNQSSSAKTLSSLFAKRWTHKIASVFARRTRRDDRGPVAEDGAVGWSLSSHDTIRVISNRPEPTQGIDTSRFPTPFPFRRLPYDIRVIIYSHLESRPPLAPKLDCQGFYLSCRQNKREIEEFARDRLRTLFARIEDTSSVGVAIRRGSDELRNITVALPYAAFDDLGVSSSNPKWKREVLSGLHPLFAYPFDTLHIAISDDQCHVSSSPEVAAPSTNCLVESTLRYLIRDLSFMVECSNTCNDRANFTDNKQSKVEKIFKLRVAEEVPPYPSADVRARRICLSWDSRPFPHDETPLSGRIVYADPSRPQALKNANPLHPANLHTSMVYELSGADGSVGEIGIVSPTRWPLHNTGRPSVKHMVDSFDLHRGSIVSSKGSGMKLEQGIAGVRIQKLEDGEDRRHKAAVDRKFDHDVFMACIEEGYFPD
ncbi:uncharacterized protein EKO05_0002671 [Ascochyta rabiei]|uniref:Uncharacterized protein n=1 Tax=Didymella rabiei TaxID=5454 RepID=A0A163GN65_DIDRA|nr:uncharacterized protein EKO05_0002671 [Ascochyta rabiei]KZM24932.1 hypothetical protein ST47_g3922 [Ascochyta rabiei]UPX12100.1 hypothetical protein EKO05_0002671 [Ascochyta rabiei]